MSLTVSASGITFNDLTSLATGIIPPSNLAGSVGTNAWLVKTANYTALSGDRIAADTSAGSWTLTLPSSPTQGVMVTVADPSNYWNTRNLTISASNTIETLSEVLICDRNRTYITLFYNGSTWRVLR